MKVLISGCNGKMGQEVAEQVKLDEDSEILCGYSNSDSGDNDFPVFTNVNDINLIPDVIIDFSVPSATFEILEFAKKHSIPTVVATTGFTDKEIDKMKKYGELFPVFRSSNMSYEINLMSKIACQLAQKLRDADIEIVEVHHRRKIDSPSGTALLLANDINNALDNEKEFVYERHSKRAAREKKEIGIHSIRGGTEVGKHSIMFYGDNESFEISHNCTSRSVFAKGAIRAGKFILHKENGFYNMNDMM